uniref:Uncharacterized protein n=1 Tax=Ditylenchus dipsaci TaxID=166011 RepID=A0A915DID5_9BILA
MKLDEESSNGLENMKSGAEYGVYAAKIPAETVSHEKSSTSSGLVDTSSSSKTEEGPQKQFLERLINAHTVVDELLKKRGLRGETKTSFEDL